MYLIANVIAVIVAIRSLGQQICAMILLGMITPPTPRAANMTITYMTFKLSGVEILTAPQKAVIIAVAPIMIILILPPVRGMRIKAITAPPMIPKPIGRERRPMPMGSLP